MIKGLANLKKKFNQLNVDMDKAVDDAVKETAFNIQNHAIHSIATQTTGGKVYPRGKNRVHIASKPGEAPNADTGQLMGQIDLVHMKGTKVAYVGTNLDYGASLEIAKNRPWLKPAADKETPNFPDTVKKMARKQTEKAGR